MEKLNGVDVYFNMADVDFYEKYMENADRLDEAMSDRLTEEELVDYKKVVSVGRKRCEAVKAFLGKVFGEGMGENICGPANDIIVCSEVYSAIIEIASRQGKEMSTKIKTAHNAIAEKAPEI